jgi:hypothetical protein
MEPSDAERFELPEPLPSARRSRTPTLITASAVLIVAAMTNLLVVVAFEPSGSAAIVHLGLGLVQAAVAALVLMLHPAGRMLGYALGALGVVMGVAGAGDNAVSALMAVLLNLYVIYAMAVSGPSFRRR